jgi:hypothetical protein
VEYEAFGFEILLLRDMFTSLAVEIRKTDREQQQQQQHYRLL